MVQLSLTLACALVVGATVWADPAAAAPDQRMIRLPLLRKEQEHDILQTARLRQLRFTDKHLAKRQDSSNGYRAPLYNDQGSQYLINVGIGSPSQSFNVTLDTGSADLWVPSVSCDRRSCPFGGFDSSKSSTFSNLQQPFSIQYGIGSVNGTYVTDTVTVAGASVSNQQFGLATYTKDILTVPQGGLRPDAVVANGILGMGYPQLTAATSSGGQAYLPFVFNLAQQQVISQAIFSIYLGSVTDQGWVGEIIFGGIDSSKFQGDLVYLPVAQIRGSRGGPDGGDGGGSGSGNGGDNSGGYKKPKPEQKLAVPELAEDDYRRHILDDAKIHYLQASMPDYSNYYYWMVYGQGLGVSGGQKNPQFRLRRTGAFILDTGTTLTYLPNEVAISIASAIAGQDGFQLDRQSGLLIVECSAAQSTASLTLQMSTDSSLTSPSVNLTVPASQLVLPLDGDTASTAKTCLFGIAPVGSSGGLPANMFLVGDSILRGAYMVFDMAQNRVGLAAANSANSSVTSNSTNTSGNSSSSNNPGNPMASPHTLISGANKHESSIIYATTLLVMLIALMQAF
ncbi:aspartic peptidase domain-containing protein [Gongronella butleri]|nr:aspartic peptidase domain-containing protein [Gongronella butleri]